MKDRRDPLAVAVQAARLAGDLLLKSYGKLKTSQISAKSKNDFVTELDKRSEALILSLVRKHFPGDAVLAEESGVTRGGRRVWVIDPLDGTANYIHQFPMFSVSIGVWEKGHVRWGVVYDPVHKEYFTAERGKGSFLNGRRIHVSRVPLLGDALMTTGIPFRARERFDEYIDSFSRISLATSGMRRGGSAALDLAYVACGRFDGFWELDLSPWDIAAGALLVEEAGGRVTDMWGRAGYLDTGDTLATNGRIHRGLQRITSNAFTPIKKNKACLLT